MATQTHHIVNKQMASVFIFYELKIKIWVLFLEMTEAQFNVQGPGLMGERRFSSFLIDINITN